MVLVAELLIAAGILAGVYTLATRPGDRMSEVEPDRRPEERRDGPLTADELVALHIPAGFGYRKVDVDRLLDRVARQLPRAVYEPGEDPGFGVPGTGAFAGEARRTPPDEGRHDPSELPHDGRAEDRVSLTKEPDRG
jgi:hypothetical protein